MSVGARKSSFSLESRGTVVEHCRKHTVGRQRASQSSWILSLVLLRSRRSSSQSLQSAWSLLVHGPLYMVRWRSVGPTD